MLMARFGRCICPVSRSGPRPYTGRVVSQWADREVGLIKYTRLAARWEWDRQCDLIVDLGGKDDTHMYDDEAEWEMWAMELL